jgi:hypothetical protein
MVRTLFSEEADEDDEDDSPGEGGLREEADLLPSRCLFRSRTEHRATRVRWMESMRSCRG